MLCLRNSSYTSLGSSTTNNVDIWVNNLLNNNIEQETSAIILSGGRN